MAGKTPGPGDISLCTLLDGAEKTFANAEQLFGEAELLAASGAVARALCLHQISLEECSKVDTLGAWATGLVLGHDPDPKKVLAALRRHESKNMTNAFMLEGSPAETEANARGDRKAALTAFAQTQLAFHGSSNRAKNASLYVDWDEGGFVAPSDRITGGMLAETRDRNSTFLAHAFNHLKALRRLEAAPDAMRQPLTRFIEQVAALRVEKPDDLKGATDRLLAALLEEQTASKASA